MFYSFASCVSVLLCSAEVNDGQSKQKRTKAPFIEQTKKQSSQPGIRPTKGSTKGHKISSKVTKAPKNRKTELTSSRPIIGPTKGYISRQKASIKMSMHNVTISSTVSVGTYRRSSSFTTSTKTAEESTWNLNRITQMPMTATSVNSIILGEKAFNVTEAHDNILTGTHLEKNYHEVSFSTADYCWIKFSLNHGEII